MSTHAQLPPEAIQKLVSQKRNSTISAIIISLLIIALIVVSLYFIAIASLFKNEEELISYSQGSQTEETIEKPEITNQVNKKPSAPSSSMTKVIAANTPSPVAIPIPTETSVEPSLDFGSDSDFGGGWGGSGNGDGSAGGGASFFKQEVKAERIAYVIDYSLSMNSDDKVDLMKQELSKSVGSLPDTVEYSLIFFAGPAWLAGDKVTETERRRAFTIKSGGRKYDWVTEQGAFRVEPADDSKIQTAKWLESRESQRKKSLKIIEKTPLVWGTVWKYPLEMAINMTPKPDVIFFMTDGSAGSSSDKVAQEIGEQARKEGIIVNTVALKEPRAKGPMSKLAQMTGGIFTMVESDGSIKQIEAE